MIDAAELKRLVEAKARALDTYITRKGCLTIEDGDCLEAAQFALSDFLLSHASEILALVEADAKAKEPGQ